MGAFYHMYLEMQEEKNATFSNASQLWSNALTSSPSELDKVYSQSRHLTILMSYFKPQEIMCTSAKK